MRRRQSIGRRPRVMIFDHVATLSGGEIALFNLVRHLDRNLIEPVVVLGEDGPLADALRCHVDVYVLPISDQVRHARKDELGSRSIAPSALLATLRYVITLVRWMKSNNVDLVHTNSLKADVLGGLAARVAGKPLLWHLRDRISADYLPARVASIFRWLSRWLPDRIIANSKATAETLGHAPSRKIRVVHDGTTTEDFLRPERSRPSEFTTPTIGIVGRISPWKGQDVFLRAAGIVLRRYPNARFKIIGAPLFEEQDFEDSLHQMVKQLQLAEAVEFLGFQRDIPKIIQDLTILVHASTKPEPFGQVIIEAMAAAKPVVAVDAGGVPEIVTNYVHGLLTPINNAEALADAICGLLSDPAEAEAMAQRARAHVAEHFTIQKTAAGVLKVYQEVVTIPPNA